MALKPTKHIPPKKPNLFWRSLAWTLSCSELKKANFTYKHIGMERLGKNEPALILMNHSAFIDFEIAMHALWPRKFNIVTGLGGCINKEWAMRCVGCIPTRKFTTDFTLIKDIKYCLNTIKTSVLMYPEADYSYDGKAHTLPTSVAGLVKMLGAPLVIIETFGGFSYDPIYCKSATRDVSVSAEVRYVLSPEQIKQMSVDEIFEVIQKEFSFDGFRWQQENKIKIDVPYRAKDLHKILYKCPNCYAEGKTYGEGTKIRCNACNKEWTLTEYGFLKAETGKTEFDHIPDWYQWQRDCIKEEIENGDFGFDEPVDIYAIINTDALYVLGEGRVTYNVDGIRIVGYDGKLDFYKSSVSMYAIGADLHWPNVGDGICFGDNSVTYFAVPKENNHYVIKSRLASEEIYKIHKKQN